MSTDTKENKIKVTLNEYYIYILNNYFKYLYNIKLILILNIYRIYIQAGKDWNWGSAERILRLETDSETQAAHGEYIHRL